MTGLIHIVDDEPTVRLVYRATLEAEGFEVVESANAEEALAHFATCHFDAALLDLRMPGQSGLDLLTEMRERNILSPTVIISAHGDIPHAVEAIKLGAIDFLQKPLTPAHLRQAVHALVARQTAAQRTQPPVAPTSGVPLPFLLARHAIDCREFGEARYFLKEAIAQNDHPHEAHHLLGVLQQADGQLAEAQASFARSLTLRPDFAPAVQSMRLLGTPERPGPPQSNTPEKGAGHD